LQLAAAYTRKRFFPKNTSKDVFSAKDVPLGVPMTTINILTFKFSKNRHFGTDFDWTVFCGQKLL